jgi:aminopeptidase N
MGYDQLKAGLHKYFDKYAWQNTELSDFVNTLANNTKVNQSLT